MATGNAAAPRPYSSYERGLVATPLNREGQDPGNGGVLSTDDATTKPPAEAEKPFTGKGELLEADDTEAFRRIHALVQRQEPLAINRLQLDKHYTATKLGYFGSSLIKVEDQNRYQQSFLPGTLNRLTTAAVPNKQADLCQKLVETLLVDPLVLDPQAEDDDETAQRGADMAREYLLQDAGEAGTDDLTLFAAQIEGATTRASTFNHYWVDPVGGGSIPKQIKAHPRATDPARPLDAIDEKTGRPIPTTDYILRYVTAGDETGQGAQFTVHPSEADRVWVPRLRVEKLGREHVRLYPETADLHHAQQAIVLSFCTVSEGRRRWPETVGQMDDAALALLCQWAPPRANVLLPAALRNRWRESRTDQSAAKVDDQRIFFHYTYYGLSEPDYPEGAVLCVSGADSGTVLERDTLSATVEMPSQVTQDETVTDRKDLDIPMVQNRLLADVDERDPTGIAFMARIAGGGEAASTVMTAYLEAIDQRLHPVHYSMATSPVDGDDVESARLTGDFVPVNGKDDVPVSEEPNDLPGEFFPFLDTIHAQLDSAAGIRPPDSAREQKVKSGVALRIEVEEAQKTLTRMSQAVHASWSRHGRIKLQMAMKHFDVPQLLRYVGVDGAAKQEWFTGNSFARVGNVTIKSGTGTMLPWSEKINLAIQLAAIPGMMDPDEAADIARPAFARQLGAPENPHVQRIERQVSAFLEGPPKGWVEEQAAFQQAAMQHAQMAQQMIGADPLAAEGAQLPPPPEPPWTPFATLPMDAEPPIATIRKRRLARLMAKTEFAKFDKAWQSVVENAYTEAVEAIRASQVQAAPSMAGPGSPQAGADSGPIGGEGVA